MFDKWKWKFRFFSFSETSNPFLLLRLPLRIRFSERARCCSTMFGYIIIIDIKNYIRFHSMSYCCCRQWTEQRNKLHLRRQRERRERTKKWRSSCIIWIIIWTACVTYSGTHTPGSDSDEMIHKTPKQTMNVSKWIVWFIRSYSEENLSNHVRLTANHFCDMHIRKSFFPFSSRYFAIQTLLSLLLKTSRDIQVSTMDERRRQ